MDTRYTIYFFSFSSLPCSTVYQRSDFELCFNFFLAFYNYSIYTCIFFAMISDPFRFDFQLYFLSIIWHHIFVFAKVSLSCNNFNFVRIDNACERNIWERGIGRVEKAKFCESVGGQQPVGNVFKLAPGNLTKSSNSPSSGSSIANGVPRDTPSLGVVR